jgi:hypothetical protein
MGTRRKRAAGVSTFFPFVYLHQAALNAWENAKVNENGANYQRVSAVLFAAFAVEAHLNHIGELKIPNWDEFKRLPWKSKLFLIGNHLSIVPDFAVQPWGTVEEVFNLRDNLAHGKTKAVEIGYERSDFHDDVENDVLDWLSRYHQDQEIERLLSRSWDAVKLMHEKAGFDEDDLRLIGSTYVPVQKRS